ncbi:glutathione ABC transporter substrate-binding protein [Bacillus sp. AGMB 02131]|uniref:Glutathione ABC transporter substrate-binding protein n=1 Tax=Peribacillus faecalis TaxID=2772559 RepID=A0A927D1W1_9BACI|nr:glutathione ABC transporter substrate-binding protein [Peribacillus faecalis]MBD3109995.1 glutathione ABC transporter substrate-binding protein [Peribacillus faecalis]
MKKKKNWFLMLVMSLVLALAACSGDSKDTSSKEDDKEKETAQSSDKLVWAVSSDAPTLDPHGQNDSQSNNVTSQIFDRLVDYSEDGTVIPMLAESFEAIEDTVWEFKLKQGVKFHDGTDFNAEAVKANIDRILSEELASPKAFILNMITEVVIVDDYTVQLKTEFPFGALPAHLAHNAGSIIAPSAIEEEKSGGKKVDENPIGTGPFKLEKWERGAQIDLVKNDDYWGEASELQAISAVVVPEQSTRNAMIETGEAHVIQVGSQDVKTIEGFDFIDLIKVNGTRMDYVGFNVEKEPFGDVKVRQAISMAIDKESIVSGVLDEQGLAAVGPLAPTVVGNSQELKPLEFDAEKAKALLAEAGYPDGFTTTLWVNEASKERADIAEYVQANLQEIGVTVNIEVVEWGAFLEKTAAGEHDMFILGWTTVTADADYGLYALFHSSQFGDPGNRSFYKNEKVDELLDKGRQSVDQEERNAAYKEVSEILVQEVPVVYLQHPDFVFGQNGVEGLFVNFSGTPFFKDVTFK